MYEPAKGYKVIVTSSTYFRGMGFREQTRGISSLLLHPKIPSLADLWN
jgi:hypothetical protein